MKSNVWTIVKKELSRFFSDRRLVISILMPGILIYVLYNFMGSALSNVYSVDEDYTYTVAVQHMPQSLKPVFSADGVRIAYKEIQDTALENAKQDVVDSKTDLCIQFPPDFDRQVADRSAVPQVSVYYNAANTTSTAAYTLVTGILDNYESAMANVFDVNAGEDTYNLADEKDETGMIFSSMMPMLLLIFLFTGCMAVAPESIAGEKERGTIATLLVTPLKRSELAIGKIIALAVMALLSGASSTIGTLLSLPKLMGAAAEGMNATMYTPADYAVLCVVILSTVILLITLISVVSALAKTIKEAQMWVTPLMIVVMLIGITAMFGNGAKAEWYYYLIPLYNSVQCMIGIFSFQSTGLHVAIMAISSICYAGLGVFALAKMFDNEKILFSK